MRIKCNICSKAVSTEVPEGTIIRAFIECPECIEKIHRNGVKKQEEKANDTLKKIIAGITNR